jgi:hypothetical protein
VEAALDTITDDVVWVAPTANGLNRSFTEKEAVGNTYRQLWASMRNVNFQPLQRFATDARHIVARSKRTRSCPDQAYLCRIPALGRVV